MGCVDDNKWAVCQALKESDACTHDAHLDKRPTATHSTRARARARSKIRHTTALAYSFPGTHLCLGGAANELRCGEAFFYFEAAGDLCERDVGACVCDVPRYSSVVLLAHHATLRHSQAAMRHMDTHTHAIIDADSFSSDTGSDKDEDTFPCTH